MLDSQDYSSISKDEVFKILTFNDRVTAPDNYVKVIVDGGVAHGRLFCNGN